MSRYHFLKSAQALDPDEILVDSVSALKSGDILESKIEKPISRLSSILFLALIGIGFIYLVARAAALQVASGDEFFARSQENRFVVRSLFPPRGSITDRWGNALVDNIASFGLVFEKEEFSKALRDAVTENRACAASGENSNNQAPNCPVFVETNPSAALRSTVEKLGGILGKDSAFFADLGFSADYEVNRLPSRIIISQDVPVETVVSIASHLDELPGVQVTEHYRREYKYPLALSHLLGYTAKISDEDLKARPEMRDEQTIGKSGIEAYYDSLLRGKSGKKIIEVNSKGHETQFKLTQQPEDGTPLRLAIDGDLQETAYEILDSYIGGKKGASVVMMDPRTGAIRALVSYPGFDGNKFGTGISSEEFQTVVKNPLTPLFNRSVAGEFPSGSTFKPLMAAAALQERVIDPLKSIYDEGYIEIPNPFRPGEVSTFRDWKKHGWVNMYDAIAESANVYFYTIGGGYKDQQGLGIDRIKKYASAFGFGSTLGIDLPGERPGFIPDPETKKTTDPNNPIWRIGDTYNVSIGQGGFRATPLQIASLTATVANGGTLYTPHILDSVLDKKGNVVKKTELHSIRTGMVDPDNLTIVRDAMRKTVTSGTARMLNDLPVTAGAKTGTAQTGGGAPHAWITAFAPFENPEIAITVMVEHAGEGATVAGPITREILNWYFTHMREGQ